MTADDVFAGGVALVGLIVFAVSAWACRLEIRAVRMARSRAPFDGVDLRGYEMLRLRPPPRWPEFDAVTDPHAAAAYSSLADDRAITHLLVGELLLVVGGAGLGLAIPLYGGWLGAGVVPALILVAIAGAGIRLRATRRWEPIADRYRERYEALTERSLPERRRGRGFLGALLRRR